MLTLVPEATDTAFFQTSGEMAGAGQKRTPAQVVATGLKALEQRRTLAIDGGRNRLAAGFTRLVSPRSSARVMGRLLRPSEHA